MEESMKTFRTILFCVFAISAILGMGTAFGQSTQQDQTTQAAKLNQAEGIAADTTKLDSIPANDSFIPFEIAPQPLPDHSPQPAYPDSAKASGKTGKVMVKAYIDKAGIVRKYIIAKVEPTGYGFAHEVESIIMDWRFTPAIQEGKPVGVWVAIPFNFKYHK
jgi:TonB family protein